MLVAGIQQRDQWHDQQTQPDKEEAPMSPWHHSALDVFTEMTTYTVAAVRQQTVMEALRGDGPLGAPPARLSRCELLS
jgi:hypothetical protein